MHLEKWRGGTEPLENVASCKRHRKEGRCRTHVGNSMCEHDANSYPNHTKLNKAEHYVVTTYNRR